MNVVGVEGEEDYESLDHIGRLLAFAFVTNTRVVGQVDDSNPKFLHCELWSSFASEGGKKVFLLVSEDGYGNPGEEGTLTLP